MDKKNYLSKGFYEADGKTISADLFDTEAKNIADGFAEEKINKKGETEYYGVSATQMRRFFDEIKRFDRLLSMQNQDWDKQKAYIKMLKSKIKYTVARIKDKDVNKKYYIKLSEFICAGIDKVKNAEDYHVFTSLVEAVYGFYYEFAPGR